jgi:Tol biopolymer transport system component
LRFQYFGQAQPATFGSIPIEGGQITQIAQLPQRIFRRLRWTPDGSAIAYIDDRSGTRNVWAVPAGGGEPKQLTDFNTDQLFTSIGPEMENNLPSPAEPRLAVWC